MRLFRCCVVVVARIVLRTSHTSFCVTLSGRRGVTFTIHDMIINDITRIQ